MGLEVFFLLKAFASCSTFRAAGKYTQNSSTKLSPPPSSAKAFDRASGATGQIHSTRYLSSPSRESKYHKPRILHCSISAASRVNSLIYSSSTIPSALNWSIP